MTKIINPRRFIISTILVILILGIVVYKLYNIGSTYFGQGNSLYQKTSTIAVEQNKDIENNLVTISYKDMVVTYYNNSLRAYSKEGEEKWSLGQKIAKPGLNSSEEWIYLFDYEAGFVNAINQGGEITWTIDIGQPIEAFVSSNTNISMVIQGEKGKNILLFDKEGKKISTIQIKSGTIMDMAITYDGELVAVSLLSTENNVIENNIILYSKEGKLLGGNKYDDIIGNMFFSKDNRILSVGVENIIAFHKENGLLWKNKTLDSINKLAWNGERFLSINYVNNKNSILDMKPKSYISIIDIDGKELTQVSINDITIDMDFLGDKVVAAGERTLYFVNNNAEKVQEKKINKDIREVQFISESQLIVITEDSIEIFSIE